MNNCFIRREVTITFHYREVMVGVGKLLIKSSWEPEINMEQGWLEVDRGHLIKACNVLEKEAGKMARTLAADSAERGKEA